MCTNTGTKSSYNKKVYITIPFLCTNMIFYLSLFTRFIPRFVYFLASTNRLRRISLCISNGTATTEVYSAEKFRSYHALRAQTPRIELKVSASNHSPAISSALLLMLSSATSLWSSSSVVLHLRHTQSSSLSTSSGPVLHSMYCTEPYSAPLLSLWEFRRTSSSTLPT